MRRQFRIVLNMVTNQTFQEKVLGQSESNTWTEHIKSQSFKKSSKTVIFFSFCTTVPVQTFVNHFTGYIFLPFFFPNILIIDKDLFIFMLRCSKDLLFIYALTAMFLSLYSFFYYSSYSSLCKNFNEARQALFKFRISFSCTAAF